MPDPNDDNVLRMPPEPPIGTTVEAVGGRLAGKRWEHQAAVNLAGGWCDMQDPQRSHTTWRRVMYHSAPDGVRVIPPAQLRAEAGSL